MNYYKGQNSWTREPNSKVGSGCRAHRTCSAGALVERTGIGHQEDLKGPKTSSKLTNSWTLNPFYPCSTSEWHQMVTAYHQRKKDSAMSRH